MAAKFDIEQVKKHLFWILLGVAALIEIVAIALLMLSDPAAADRKQYLDSQKEMKSINDFKNDKFLPPWAARKGEFTDEKKVIWEKAWKPQEPIYDFPLGIKKLEYPDEKPSSAELTSYRDRYYKDQFDRSVAEASATKYEIEYKNGNPDRYLLLQGPSPIAFGGAGGAPAGGGMAMAGSPPGGEGGAMMGSGAPGGGSGAPPTSVSPGIRGILGELPTFTIPPNPEEFWILQEDLSVRRELVHTLRKALAEMAVMTRKPASKENTGAVVLVNSFWELTLIPEAGGRLSPKSTIRNVHCQGRPQALYDKALNWKTEFLIAQGANTKVVLSFDGDPLPYGQARSFRDFAPMNIGTLDLNQEFLAAQTFRDVNCPLRRVMAIELGAAGQDMRNFKPADLKTRSTLPEEKGDEVAAGGEGAGSPGGPPGGDGGMMSMGGSPGGPGGAPATPRNVTALNRLDRARYLVSNEVCRHIPIAIRLQVDQSQVNTILTTLANNRLRMQITQVEWNHLPRKRLLAGGGPGGSGFPGAAPGGFPAMGSPPGGVPPGLPAMGSGGPGRPPGVGFGVPGAAAPGAVPSVGSNPNLASLGLEDGNLIDLTVYAIGSLYERYPPKEGAETAGGSSADPSAAPKTPMAREPG